MLKKIILGAALLASTSFATYSYFPVPEAMHGDAKLVADFDMQDKYKDLQLTLKGRFVPVQNLELTLSLPYMVFTKWDGEDTNGDGMKNLSFGARYQVIPTVAAFLDMTFPTGKDEINDDGFGFYFGGQYSQKFGNLDFGSELGLGFNTEGDDKFKGPMQLTIAAELDPIVSPIISPYVGASFKIALGDPKYDGHKNGDTSGDVGFFPYVGANFKITDMFSADLCALFGFGKDYLLHFYGNKKTPITLEASFNASF